jgi:integrase
MARRGSSNDERATRSREVLEFECGVSAYEPASRSGYWRLRWLEAGRRRDTTAKSRAEAVAKAGELVERLSAGTPTSLGSARGSALVARYLDPGRRPARGRAWSERHREEQESYCRRFVVPVIGEVPVRRLTRAHMQAIVERAATKSVGEHLYRCVSAMVGCGLEEGLLLVRQDVLRGVHWHGPDVAEVELDDEDAWERSGRAVEEADIPTATAVHALASAAAARRGVWWRELEVLLVAYSGLRWGEHAALTADRVDLARRRITVDRQVIETSHGLKLAPPKNRRRRTTMFPSKTPSGVDLAALVERRLGELPADGLLFPSPKGHWARRSNYRRNLFDPAATAAGWPRRADGRWQWTFHSLRHVFATWALAQPGARIEDVSRLLGHSTVRVTQDIYIAPDADLYDRFYQATG